MGISPQQEIRFALESIDYFLQKTNEDIVYKTLKYRVDATLDDPLVIEYLVKFRNIINKVLSERNIQ